MALRFIGYVSESNTREVSYSSLWKRNVAGEHIFIEIIDNSEPQTSHVGLSVPIEIFSVNPAGLHVVQQTVDELSTFIWWVLVISLLGIFLVGIIAISAMYKVCQLKPSCSQGATCEVV